MADAPTASTPTPGEGAPPRAGPLATLGWAAYLACSWTWCIGMFLPVLLVRDYGIWGFVVFAVPNVVGAAAMGWVLRDGAAERSVQRHAAALVAFSAVTIAFQVYFAGWFVFRLARTTGGYEAQYPLVLGLTAAVILAAPVIWAMIMSRRAASRMALAVLVLLVSAAAGVAMLNAGLLDGWHVPTPPRRGTDTGLLWMAPVCVFGFALCPYGDLTFLRARRALGPGASRVAFTFGFGVLFAAMILLTLVYAPTAMGLMGHPVFAAAASTVIVALAVHMTAQLAATIGFHLDETLRLPEAIRRPAVAVVLTAIVIACVAVFAVDWQVVRRLDMMLGEVIYRVFMAFYGLVFPTYVWLCMIPTADGHSGTAGPRARLKLSVFAAAVALAAPCYWMGFIERREWWLGVGLGIVLLARLAVRAKPTVA